MGAGDGRGSQAPKDDTPRALRRRFIGWTPAGRRRRVALLLATLTFLALAIAAWAFFTYTTPHQRGRWAVRLVSYALIFGAGGFLWEVWARGGRLPIAW